MSFHIHNVEPGGAVDDQAALEQFQKQWMTYQKVVDHDSPAHKESAALLLNPTGKVDRASLKKIAAGDHGHHI
jgi:hypothetical protein